MYFEGLVQILYVLSRDRKRSNKMCEACAVELKIKEQIYAGT